MNISELAEHLNLSVSTVSRALSGSAAKYRISAATVKKVRDAAAQHQVVADPVGTGLRTGQMGLVGLMVPDITNPFFSELARAIEMRLRQAGLAVLLTDSNEDHETEAELLLVNRSRRLNGLLLAPVGGGTASILSLAEEGQVPLVILDRVIPELKASSVSLNNYQAGRLAAGYLADAGHRRIGCLRGNPEAHPDQERLRGIVDALKERGIKLAKGAVAGTGYSREASIAGARRVLGAASPPTAVITLAGQGVPGILQAAEERSLSIPEDLSVLAFDEQPWSAYVKPPLTTVVQPIEAMAEAAVQALLEPEVRGGQHVLSARIEERQSVRRV